MCNHIINIGFAPLNPCYHLVYHSLKCGRCIMHAKRHYSVLIQPLRGTKAESFVANLVRDTCQYPFKRSNVVTGLAFPTRSIRSSVLGWIWVSSCNSIQLPEVCAKSIGAIWLRHWHTGTTPLTTTWLDDLVLQHMLNFFPKILQFDWINPVRTLPTYKAMQIPLQHHEKWRLCSWARRNKCWNWKSSFFVSLCSSDVRWDNFLCKF